MQCAKFTLNHTKRTKTKTKKSPGNNRAILKYPLYKNATTEINYFLIGGATYQYELSGIGPPKKTLIPINTSPPAHIYEM